MKSTIEINFFYFQQKYVTKFKLPFMSLPENITSDKYNYDLPNDLFKFNKVKAVLTLILYSNIEGQEYKFYVYKGANTIYVQLEFLFDTVFELIIKSSQIINLRLLTQKFDKLDTLGNKYRKRLTLVNIDNKIIMDEKVLNFRNIFAANYNHKEISDSISGFFQISFEIDNEVKEKKKRIHFIMKNIEDKKEKDEERPDLKLLKSSEKSINEFFEQLKIGAKSNNFYLNFGNFMRLNKHIFKIEAPNIHKDSGYINDQFRKLDLTNLKTFFNINFIHTILKNENIINDQSLLLAILNKSQEEFDKLDLEQNIEMDEKIKILSVYLSLYNKCTTLSDLNLLKIRTYILSKKQDNSIMDKVCKFFDKFIEDLTEDSPIFFYLLQLNSGVGHSQNQIVYSFDLKNVDMIKSHLKSLFPKSLTIFNDGKNRTNELAFFTDKAGGIGLNEIYLAPEKKYDIDYNSNKTGKTEEESDEIAINIVLYLLHEFLGHKKFHHSEEGYVSPKKIVKNNSIIELKHVNEFYKNENNCEYILSSSTGHFVELCYGKFNGVLIIKILSLLKNKGKFIKRPDLFLDSGETLKNYTTLRAIAEDKKIELQFNDETSIEEDINYMNSKIDVKAYMEEKEKENEKNRDKDKKKKKNKFSYELEEKEDKGNYLKLYQQNEESEVSDDIKNEEDDRFNRILEKFKFENDEYLKFNVEQKLKEDDLSDEDFKDLNYLYLKFINIY